MNDAARDAMTMAASEYDRCASKVETMADLLRQIAGHARRGEISEIERIREEIANLSDLGDDLARKLVDSVRERDPDHWRAENRKTAIRIVGRLPVYVLSLRLGPRVGLPGWRRLPGAAGGARAHRGGDVSHVR